MGNTVAEPATESDTEPELAPNLERSPEIPYCISPTPPAGENVNIISSADSLSQLHWLFPVSKRIVKSSKYMLLMLTNYSASIEPAWLSSPFFSYETNKNSPALPITRTSHKRLLHQPFLRYSSTGECAFSSASPAVYNATPLEIRSAPSVDSFKRQLKTFYCNSLSH